MQPLIMAAWIILIALATTLLCKPMNLTLQASHLLLQLQKSIAFPLSSMVLVYVCSRIVPLWLQIRPNLKRRIGSLLWI